MYLTLDNGSQHLPASLEYIWHLDIVLPLAGCAQMLLTAASEQIPGQKASHDELWFEVNNAPSFQRRKMIILCAATKWWTSILLTLYQSQTTAKLRIP